MAAEVLVRPAREERLRAALWFAERGFGVFSVWSANDDGVCRCPKGNACESPGKHPVPGIGFKAATTDPELIRRMLEIPSDPNWGMLPPDGVFALDVDGAGVQELAKLEARYGALPATLRTATAHGQHIFLRWPDEHPRPIGQLFGFVTRWGSGRDAGYVIGPRSVHATGKVYAPVAGSLEIAEMPEAWARAAVGTPPEATLTFSAGYQLPDRFPPGTARYKEILRYTAHLYDTSRLSRAEMWPLVRDVLAPRFAEPLGESELRERFDRVTKDMGKRLGERRNVPSEAQAPVELDDAPLTEFDSEPVQWLWGSWLPRGVVTLMDGNPGVSKSTLVADLVARVTTGRDWPDGTAGRGTPARAMWITTEDDPGRVLRPRIEAAGGDASLVRFVKGEVVFPSGKDAFTDLVVRRARERAGLALVILDPLFSHIDATVRTIADAEMRKGVMSPLTAAAEAADVAILVVRHFSKDTTASAVNRGAGSLGGIVGAARALWTVIADPEDESGETKVVGVSKLNYARAHKALRYRVVDRVPPGWATGSVSGIQWLGEASTSIETMLSAGPRSGEAARALEEILAAGPVAASVAENRMRSRGFGVAATRGAKARLGVVARKTSMTGGWAWELPEPEGADEGNAFQDAEGDPSTPSASSGDPRARPRAREEPSPSAPSTSSAPSKASKASKALALPTGAPPREEPGLQVIGSDATTTVSCHFYRDHQAVHHRGPDGHYHCAICSPCDVSAGCSMCLEEGA